jgi:hypothetical protein
MPQVTPQFGPLFPFRVGALYNGGYQNGQLIYRQPGGVGTPVVPLPPQTSPPSNWKHADYKPIYPTVFLAFLAWPCGHWINEPEIFQVYDGYAEVQAALLCCSVCSYIGYIIEPAEDWWQAYFQIYPLGLREPGAGLIPNET